MWPIICLVVLPVSNEPPSMFNLRSIFSGFGSSGSEMRSYEVQIIPKIRCFSMRLDQFGQLTDSPWVLFSEKLNMRHVWVFRPSGKLILHRDGKIIEGRWEGVGERSLVVELPDKSYLFSVEFVDHTLIALKYDRHDAYVILIAEQKHEIFLNNIGRVNTYLKNTYTVPSRKTKLSPLKTVYDTSVKYTVDDCEFCGSYLSKHSRDVFKVGSYQICSDCAERYENVARYTTTMPIISELEQMKKI